MSAGYQTVSPEVLHWAELMPDEIKIAVVGLGIEPPILRPGDGFENVGLVLESLVNIGVATSTKRGEGTAYRLTDRGRELFRLVRHQTPKEPMPL